MKKYVTKRWLKKLIKEDRLSDANWYIVRVMNKAQRAKYTIFAAEEVINIFNSKHLENDSLCRKARAIIIADAETAAADAETAADYVTFSANYVAAAVAYLAAYTNTAAAAGGALKAKILENELKILEGKAGGGSLKAKILENGLKILEGKNEQT